MDRRKFLLGSTFTAAAFSEPALFALTVPPAENTSRVSGRRIGMPDVEIITENIAHLRRLDHRYGSGRVREQVVQTDLATAHLVGRDYEHAAILGRDAVRTAVQVSSTRTLDRLRTLQRQVHLLRTNSKHLGELDERITDLLTRNRAHRDEHTTIS
ncbi:MAG: hypothetical protein JO100_07950 [Pseudonocardia sp.]|nr:hypothetical protein [Pseudonocardia sp.]